MNKKHTLAIGIISTMLFYRCSEPTPDTLFTELSSKKTGVTFINEVKQDGDNHILNYSYFFNGGGVAVGDINNDGWVDIYFTANQKSNKLYLNKGNFTFEDITEKAGVGAEEGWKTGVTFTDINQDGWLDIYVCRSAMSDSLLRKNLLFINNKDLTFTEKAAEYGIDDSSYSTQAAFFDYDNDNDLDLFILNHSVQRYAGFSNLLNNAKRQKSDKFGSKLYENKNGKYVNVTDKAGLINNVLSFGLGVAVTDLNRDGFLDMYISNDFNEEDYLYMNNGNGTFTNTITKATDHVSLFSMGSDAADINNDGLVDIYTLDMLPASNERIKLSSGDDNYDKYQLLIDAGFHHQTTRNMLQLNNGDGTFSEIGQLAGISNTDWSWSALFNDFDGDGLKDLYVTNGYEKDYTNMQFLKFTVDEQLKSRQTGVPVNVQAILDHMPAINEGNFIFKNNGDLTFTNKNTDWGITKKMKSSGAAYADLDNDGDQDLVINGMNIESVVYRNNSAENKLANFIKVDVLKKNPGMNVTGTKLQAYGNGVNQFFEFSPVRGYQSCMMSPVSIGIGNASELDSLRITWPNGKQQTISAIKAGETISPAIEEAMQYSPYQFGKPGEPLFDSVKLIDWKQKPKLVNDFKRQLLLPHMYSYSGSPIITGDVNKDGLEDIFIGGPKGQSSALFLQQKNGAFKAETKNSFSSDSLHQNEGAHFFDADGDKDLDLYLVGGGYLYEMGDPLLQDRFYKNDGKGNFSIDTQALPMETSAGAVVISLDADGDKDLDLFVGGRITPGQYPVAPQSLLLINDGKGKFTDEIVALAPGLQYAGMITAAKAVDINKDGWEDLIIGGEWMPLQVWINQAGKFTNETSKWFPFANHGWWNCIELNDFDNDGDLDIIAGNAGTNNQFGVSEKHPATMVFKDFNFDGQVDPFLCYYINGTSYPYASRDEALGQVSFLKPRFPDYNSYANVTLEKLFKPGELQDTVVLIANELRTLYFENNGTSFEKKELPIEAQWSPIYSIASIDINQDGLKDVIMGGNETYVRVRLGRNCSNRGLVFINKGNGNFEFVPNEKSGLILQGDVRQIKVFNGENVLVVGSVANPIQTYSVHKSH